MSKATGEKWDGKYRVIDCHVHGDPARYRGSGSAYVRKIRGAGIDAICLLAPGEACKKAVDRFGADFIIPIAMYRLRDFGSRDLRADMERWLDWGCHGIKFIAPLHPYSDERYWPMYEMIDRRGSLAMFHTGYLGFSGTTPEIPPTRMTDMRAAHIDALARRFPSLRIHISHFSNPWWEEAWKIVWSRPNVTADLSGLTAIRRSLDMWERTFAPDGALMEGVLAKLCFASDVHYLHNGPHDFQPYVDFTARLLDRLNAPHRLRQAVWAGTARKVFGIR